MDTNKLSIPGAIIIAGIIIGGAVLYAGRQAKTDFNPPPEPKLALEKTRPIGSDDHFRGSREASAVIVEYSDLECPFCKDFHQTLRQVLQDYKGKVAWVYRNLPLDRHPQAQKEAEASECVNVLGGSDKYWQFVDKIFEITPSNNGLDLNLLPQIAESLGIKKADFETCLNSNRYATRVQADTDNAAEIGAQGTPFSVILFASGQREVIPGALPLEQVKMLIDKGLK